jgi:hypothetical protein
LPRNVGLPESRPSSKPIQRCRTSNCAVDSKFVQPNGFCAQVVMCPSFYSLTPKLTPSPFHFFCGSATNERCNIRS